MSKFNTVFSSKSYLDKENYIFYLYYSLIHKLKQSFLLSEQNNRSPNTVLTTASFLGDESLLGKASYLNQIYLFIRELFCFYFLMKFHYLKKKFIRKEMHLLDYI